MPKTTLDLRKRTTLLDDEIEHHHNPDLIETVVTYVIAIFIAVVAALMIADLIWGKEALTEAIAGLIN